MHLRRALLLFAIVLALAALATSISAPRERSGSSEPARTGGTPSASPGPNASAPPSARLALSAGAKPATREVRPGTAAVLTVDVAEAGLVEIPGLGLTRDAAPATPATFDVLSEKPGRFDVLFTPAGSQEARRVGTLRVRG